MRFTYCVRCSKPVINGICGCTSSALPPSCPACEAAARELATLQAAYAQVSAGAEAMQGQLADLHSLCDRQADILSRVAVALRGPEPPLTKWSHADLPERAEAILTDHICEQCEELIPLEHPCRCSVCWNKTVGELADLRARFTAAIDDLQEMAAVMKKHQMLPHTSAAIAERVAELTGNNFQPDDLRERIEAEAYRWRQQAAILLDRGNPMALGLEQAAQRLLSLLAEKEAK